jgi:Ni/Co efflux regulator RcnB
MKQVLFASILVTAFAGTAFAQSQPAPAAKPAAKSTKPVKAKEVPAASKRQAIEEATPTTEPDPSIKLSEAQLAIAKTVHTGEIACELGQKVTIRPMKREGFFFVSRGVNRFVMHPEESRTGAIRLEDPARGALWLQLANKSMLMNQKEGKRLADECQSPEQVAYAKNMKPVNLLEPGK